MPQRIAIVGAGPAGLATAFHLTEARSRGRLDPSTEIVVYESSWRPGGKGASGRNLARGSRIEEHGIHLFGAFYLNAARMVRACYEELCGPEDGLRHVEHELMGNSVVMSRVTVGDDTVRWFGPMPRSDGAAWDPPDPAHADLHLDLPMLLEKVAGFAARAVAQSEVLDPIPPHGDPHRHLDRITAALGRAAEHLEAKFLPAVQGAELFAVVLRGILADHLTTAGVDSIDGEDHLAWLRRHGLSEATLRSSLVEAIPAVCFQFPGGDSTRPASMSAAAFVATAARQLMAPGEFQYFFRRGTGESVILPVFLALSRRGVQFRWGHQLVAGRATGGRVETIAFRALVAAPGGEAALIPVAGSSSPPDGHACRSNLDRAWPSDPPEGWDPAGPTELVELHHGRDFDAVVLAVPPATLRTACPELDALAGLDAALPSVSTVAAQLWLTPTSAELGLPVDELSGEEKLGGSDWEDPFNGWTDFSGLIGEEAWAANDRPGALLYFCGTVPDGSDAPDVVARRELERLTDRVGALVRGGEPSSVRGDLFVPGPGPATDGQRLDAQYARVNSVGSERYVLAGPGTLEHRPRAWESGYSNVALAGDWTRNGYNVSSFEASVMSGALASFAVCGGPDPGSVAGYRVMRPDDPADMPPAGWSPILG